jgi:hypothetical protein
MPDCEVCAELSKRLDQALSGCGSVLTQFREALASGDQERMDALDVELVETVARRNAAFRDWAEHRVSHKL